MILQIRLALKDIIKNLPSIIFFVTQIIIFTIFATIVLDGLNSSINYNKSYEKINKYNIIGFKPYYLNKDSYKFNYELISYTAIEKKFAENKALSFIDIIRIKKYSDTKVIIGLGMFRQVYGFDNRKDINVLIGSEIKDIMVGESFELGDKETVKLTISGYMKPNTSFFRNSYLSSLDNSILILMSYSDFSKLFLNENYNSMLVSHRKMIMNTNLKLIDPSFYEIEAVIEEINYSNEIAVIPIDYNDYISKVNIQIKENTSFFIIVIIGAFIFISIGVINNLLNLVDNNFTEYSINIMYGGNIFEVYQRMLFYICMIVFPSFLIAFNFLLLVDITKSIPIVLQLLISSITSIIISIVPFWKFKKENMLYFLRRNL